MNEIQTIEKDINPVLTQALELSITTNEDMELASSLRERIKNTINIVKDVKEVYYRPAKQEVDNVNAKYDPVLKKIEAADKDLSSKMSVCHTRMIAEAKAEAGKIASRVAPGRGNLSPATAMEKIANIETPTVLSETNFINRPKLSITDINLIPHEYLIVDEKKLEADLKSGKVVAGATLVDSYEPRTR